MADPANPVLVANTSAQGKIWGVQQWDNLVFAAVYGGSVYLYDFANNTLGAPKICHSSYTAFLSATPPDAAGKGYVYTTEERRFSAIWELSTEPSFGINIQAYSKTATPPAGSLVARVDPTEAATDGCKAEPAQPQTAPVGSKVSVTATEAGAWNFKQWTGAASGSGKQTEVTITGQGMEAVAHFVKPILTLGGGKAPKFYCPKDPVLTNDVEVLSLTLSVNDVAGWLVTAITFQGSGADGHEYYDIEDVKLYKDGALLSHGRYAYPADNGTIVLNVNQQIPAGGSINLSLRYLFQASRLTNAPLAKEFKVETKADWVQAQPDTPAYAHSVKLPPTPVAGGPLVIAPVWNINTGKGFAKIQEAEDAETTQNGHTIQVCPGQYVENVIVDKSVTIKSLKGWEETSVIAADVNANVFLIRTSQVTLDGFEIRGAVGIWSWSSSNERSCGVRVDPTSPLAQRPSDCVIQNNNVRQNGDGIVLKNTSECLVAGNRIWDNQADGILIDDGLGDMVLGNEIGASAVSLGNKRHGLHIQGSAASIYVGQKPDSITWTGRAGNTISFNGGGIVIEGMGKTSTRGFYVSNNHIVDNVMYGVMVLAASKVEIGEEYRDGHNYIDRNGWSGVAIFQSSNIKICGNAIGIAFSGESAGNRSHGVEVTDSTEVVIGGLAESPGLRPGNMIVRNSGYGVSIRGTSSAGAVNGIKVLGNRIGTLSDETKAGNGLGGIRVWGSSPGVVTDTQIGGSSSRERNVISGNNGPGITLENGSRATTVRGNFIGTSDGGSAGLGNGGCGILVWNSPDNRIGGEAWPGDSGNVISGNLKLELQVEGEPLDGHGILLLGAKSTGNRIQGNNIGLAGAGYGLLEGGARNQGSGIRLAGGAAGNEIGGEREGPNLGNVISGNAIHGIHLGSKADTNIIAGNNIGLRLGGSTAFGNLKHGIRIEGGSHNRIGDAQSAKRRNIISGQQSGSGVLIIGADSRSNEVIGNFIGTDALGQTALPNEDGVYLGNQTSDNTIGGQLALETAPGTPPGNVISGNTTSGVEIRYRAVGNRVQGNLIGTDATGKKSLGNSIYGVFVHQSSGNTIGGQTDRYRNIISANQSSGIIFLDGAADNRVIGNWIGTDVTGLSALGNREDGVFIASTGSDNNWIGGPASSPGLAPGNVISGNSIGKFALYRGVVIFAGATGNKVQGNLVGIGADGVTPLGNDGHGIEIKEANGNGIGGAEPGEGNVIGANSKAGVRVAGEGNWLTGNLIGCDASGHVRLGNQGHGVWIQGPNNLVGGLSEQHGNRIAYNQGDGLRVESLQGAPVPLKNEFLHNLVYDNNGLGIDLVPASGQAGVTPNDAQDFDGVLDANGLQNYPIVQAVHSRSEWGTIVRGFLNSKPDKEYVLEFFVNERADASGYGEGERYLGSKTVRTDGVGNVSFLLGSLEAVPVGQFITATATDPDGNTSEFSAAGKVLAGQDVDFDGVADLLEDGAPNNGDGNDDGLPDGQQDYVTSVPNPALEEFITLVSPTGTKLAEVQRPSSLPAPAPEGVTFPLGVMKGKVNNVAPAGADAPIEIHLPPGTRYNTFYRYGPAAGRLEPHWAEFVFNGTSGAFRQHNRIRLVMKDGGAGDDDLQANGSVAWMGGPALKAAIENEPPAVCPIADQTTHQGVSLELVVEIGDPETPEQQLTCAARASNPTLFPQNNITLGGAGRLRTLTLAPAPDQIGIANITFSVSDGAALTEAMFKVTVAAPAGSPGSLITKVLPPEALEDGCAAAPVRVDNVPVGNKVAVSATAAGAWNFKEWTGAASGTSLQTEATVLWPNSEAVAHFVKPVLTLGGGKAPKLYCPRDPLLTNELEVLHLTLSVNEVAGWLVRAIEFIGAGAGGHEADHLQAVRLYMGNTLLGQGAYANDNGTIELAVNRQIPAGSSIALSLRYVFKPQALTNAPLVKTFQVDAMAALVNAEPDAPAYPKYAKLPPPPVTGGPLTIAPVWNVNTGRGYAAIQEGIDAPGTLDGHTLQVCPGTYLENVKVTKSVIIESATVPNAVVRAASPVDHTFSILQSSAKILSLVIEGAIWPEYAGVYVGPGVFSAEVKSSTLQGNWNGILLDKSTESTIENNSVIGNSGSGIRIEGGSRHLVGFNFIYGNQGDGIFIQNGSGHHLSNNRIEPLISDPDSQGNAGCGIRALDTEELDIDNGVSVPDYLASVTTIAGNGLHGVWLQGTKPGEPCGPVRVRGVWIGMVPMSGAGGAMRGWGNKGHGIYADNVARLVVGGPQAGNLIGANGMSGIHLKNCFNSDTLIAGNKIGNDGAKPMSNFGHGISIEDCSKVTIGGDPGNVIAGNGGCGIDIQGSYDVGIDANEILIQGNLIGLLRLPAGDKKLGNLEAGIQIKGPFFRNLGRDAEAVVIGGNAVAQRNVISGNVGPGILLGKKSHYTKVLGNFIGTDTTGTAAIGNGEDGIQILSSGDNEVGGPTQKPGTPPGNVISGNGRHGISIGSESDAPAYGNLVKGNLIGTDATGYAPLGNAYAGIMLFGAKVYDNRLGGATALERNVISANGAKSDFDYYYAGISLWAAGSSIQGNYIGTDITGSMAGLGNHGGGISIQDSVLNSVGGEDPGQGNRIAFNKRGGGVYIRLRTIGGQVKATRNRILGNAIYENDGLGIDLSSSQSDPGVTLNDVDDSDGETGEPNQLQNFPFIQTAQSMPGQGTVIHGYLNSVPSAFFLLQFFANTHADPTGYGEGQEFLGQKEVRTDAYNNAPFVFTCAAVVRVGEFITATATDFYGNTSEFSQAVRVEPATHRDFDGIADVLEDAAPNNGDGNRDGIPDSRQDYVASFPNDQGDFFTLASQPNTTLGKVRAVSKPPIPPPPQGVNLPLGLIEFTAKIVDSGARENVELFLPPEVRFNCYYKYGATPDNQAPHWYRFDLKEDETGGVIQGVKAVLYLYDGERGDDDLVADGYIIDLGGPAFDPAVMHVADLPDLVTQQNSSAGPIPFTLFAGQAPVENLTLAARSDNLALVPDANLALGGSGLNRTLTITPAPGQHGQATIFLDLGDGTSIVSESFVLTVNRAPSAVADTILRQLNQPVKAAATTLLANDVDTEKQTLQVTAVSSPSAHGAIVRLENGWIFYEPPPGFNGSDTFTYTVTDSEGGSATATVTVNIAPENPAPTDTVLGISDVPGSTFKRILFLGIPNQAYQVQAATSLDAPVSWAPVGTCVAGPDGRYEFVDEAAGDFSQRFYRSIRQ